MSTCSRLGSIRAPDEAGLPAGLAVVDPLALPVDPPTLWRVPRDVAERYAALLVRGPEGPLLVLGDPRMPGAVRTVAAHLGLPTLPIAAGAPDRILAAIARHYDRTPTRTAYVSGLTGDQRPATLSPTGLELDSRAMYARLVRGTGAAVGDFVTAILAHAVEVGAEKVRLEGGAIRLVVDGVEGELMDLPAVHAAQVAARLRVLARLDPSGLRPVSGRCDLAVGARALQVRASFRPAPCGGVFELDLVDPLTLQLPSIGLCRKVDQEWARITATPGLVLLVGPLGSGLRAVAGTVTGAFYIPLRDPASITAAVRAADSGRLVLGRVVADTVGEALAQLRDAGVARAPLAGVLRGMLSQRRLRKVCSTCSLPAESTEGAGLRYGTFAFAAPVAGPGCPMCKYRGYVDTFFASELVAMNEALGDAIERGAPLRELSARAAPVAERTLQADAVAKAISGATTIAELFRCVPPLPAEALRPAEERHRGLFRAVTQPPPEDEIAIEALAAPDPSPCAADAVEPAPGSGLPRVVIVHPGVAERHAIRAAMASRADLQFAWAPAFVHLDPELPPDVAVLAHSAAGGWNASVIDDWKLAGVRVILLGPSYDADLMADAFALGADDYAGSVEELMVRMGRWLRPAAGLPPGVRGRPVASRHRG